LQAVLQAGWLILPILIECIASLGELAEEKCGGSREEEPSREQPESAEGADAEDEPEEGAEYHHSDTAEGEADDEAVANNGDGRAAPALDACCCTFGLFSTLVDDGVVVFVGGGSSLFIHDAADCGIPWWIFDETGVNKGWKLGEEMRTVWSLDIRQR